jgi:hypothetical protein
VAGIVDALNADKGEDLGDDAWKELLTGPNVKALTIGTGLVFFQQVRPTSRSEEYDVRTDMASIVVRRVNDLAGNLRVYETLNEIGGRTRRPTSLQA